jgi:8-oxo-dGTP pyrophosphatase MutT (NUDIX family)
MGKPDPAKLRTTAACGIVFDEQGNLLLQKRTDNGRWCLPGGSIERGETAAQAVVREVLEETGYITKVVRIVGVYSDPLHTTMRYPNGDVTSFVAIAFECCVIGGAPALSDETAEVRWCPPDALPEGFHAGHLPRVQDALARQTGAFFR